MDSWKEHWYFGLPFLIIGLFVIFILKDYSLNFKYVFSLFLILFLSPLILDIDHRLGKVREAIIFLGLSILTIGIIGILFDLVVLNLLISGMLLANIAFFLTYLFPHRGFIHSVAFVILFNILVYILSNNKGLTVLNILGMYSHLIGDKIPFKLV